MKTLLMLNLSILALIIGYWAGKLWRRLYINRVIRSRLWRVAPHATEEDKE